MWTKLCRIVVSFFAASTMTAVGLHGASTSQPDYIFYQVINEDKPKGWECDSVKNEV